MNALLFLQIIQYNKLVKNAVFVMKSNCLQYFLKTCKKMKFHENKIIQNIFNRWGMLMHIILVWFKHILLLIKSNISKWVGPQGLTTHNCIVYYFSKVYIACYRIRQENTLYVTEQDKKTQSSSFRFSEKQR